MGLIIKKEPFLIEDLQRIFERYLEICNQAIDENKDKFPYNQIWIARLRKLGANKMLQCAVYDDEPKLVYNLSLTEDMRLEIVNQPDSELKETWPLKLSYLQHVVDNPKEYVRHPASLDWGWLTGVFR